MKALFALLAACSILTTQSAVSGQHRDRGVMVEEIDAWKAKLQQQADGKASARQRKVLRPDLAALDRPASPDDFRQAWHNPPVCQGLTGQCWAYAATSFLESEIQRQTGRKERLSEWWLAYWEFVEKARRFVQRRGDSVFPRGSEPDAALRLWQKYGAIPAQCYPALPPGRSFHDDRRLYREMLAHLEGLRRSGQWDEPSAVAAIRGLLDRHLGAPPTAVDPAGLSPTEYLHKLGAAESSEYVSLMSLLQEPWHRWCKLDVPDNWWGSTGYYNLPVDEFVRVIREAMRAGGTACVVIDSTGSGFCFYQGLAVVPSFDMPSAAIDDAARQLRFSEESTTDDHVVHLVGWREHAGRYWYLVKDSGTQPRNGPHGGYMFYDEDYLRLKALAVLLPRKTVETALGSPLGPAPPVP